MEKNLNKSRKEMEALRKKLAESRRKEEKKRVILSQAACTLMAGCISEIANTGMGLQEFQTELEKRGVKPKKGESSDMVNERAFSIVFLQNGNNAYEAALLAVGSLEISEGLSDEQVARGAAKLAPILTEKFNIRMGHRSGGN